MKKQDFFIKGAAALVALVAIAGIATTSFASNGNGMSDSENPRGWGQKMSGMTEEERSDWREDMEARRTEAREALEAGDYDAWSEAVGDNCPMAGQINEENFSQFKEAHNLRGQARGMMEELGVERGQGHGRMMGHGGAGHPGFMR